VVGAPRAKGKVGNKGGFVRRRPRLAPLFADLNQRQAQPDGRLATPDARRSCPSKVFRACR